MLFVGAVLTFAGWSQTWVTLDLVAVDIKVSELVSTGQTSTVLPAGLALVTLVTGLLLLTAKRSLAYVIGVINSFSGASLILLTGLFAADPVNFQYAQLTKISGISDPQALRAIVGAQHLGFGLWIAALGGAVIVFASLVLYLGVHKWKVVRSRYESPSSAPEKRSNAAVTTLDAWDDLTQGNDPTA